jgi:hypothetical protein
MLFAIAHHQDSLTRHLQRKHCRVNRLWATLSYDSKILIERHEMDERRASRGVVNDT